MGVSLARKRASEQTLFAPIQTEHGRMIVKKRAHAAPFQTGLPLEFQLLAMGAESLGDWNAKRVREFHSEQTGLRSRVECSEIL